MEVGLLVCLFKENEKFYFGERKLHGGHKICPNARSKANTAQYMVKYRHLLLKILHLLFFLHDVCGIYASP